MSDPENHIKRPGLILTIIAVSLLMTGCAGIKRAWNGLFPPARAQMEMPVPERTPWVPLGSPWMQPSASVWPTGRYPGGGQGDGMATLIQELDHFARLVDTVSRLPAEPGEYRVNFVRIQADIAAVRAGLVEALLQPRTAPRDFPPINRAYIE